MAIDYSKGAGTPGGDEPVEAAALSGARGAIGGGLLGGAIGGMFGGS